MTLKHLTVTVCILSLSFLLKSCNAEDIDSLNSQISELTEKIEKTEADLTSLINDNTQEDALSDQNLNATISGFNNSLSTIREDLKTSVSSLTAIQTSLTQSQASLTESQTTAVNDLSSMFRGANAFNQDLSSWCVQTNYDIEPYRFKTYANSAWANDASKQPDWDGAACP